MSAASDPNPVASVPVYVVGAGGHAKVVVATLRRAGYVVAAAFDDDPDKWRTPLAGVPVCGAVAEIGRFPAAAVLVAVGDNRARRRIAEAAERDWRTAVHPAAAVDDSAFLGRGTVVFAGAVVQADARLGDHVIVNSGAVVEHDCRVGPFAHVGPRACLTGGVEVGEGAFVGAGAVVLPGRRIGAWACVGAGAVVVRDVGPGETVVGVPGRPINGGGTGAS